VETIPYIKTGRFRFLSSVAHINPVCCEETWDKAESVEGLDGNKEGRFRNQNDLKTSKSTPLSIHSTKGKEGSNITEK